VRGRRYAYGTELPPRGPTSVGSARAVSSSSSEEPSGAGPAIELLLVEVRVLVARVDVLDLRAGLRTRVLELLDFAAFVVGLRLVALDFRRAIRAGCCNGDIFHVELQTKSGKGCSCRLWGRFNIRSSI
jgi:hypothetical protein